jgi:hypothetical protein
MATTNTRPVETVHQPEGVEGDGMDPYPTYRDGAVPPHHATGTKPTDVGLPRSRRTYAMPILIGLIVFALIIALRVIWGSINVARTTDEAMTPGDAGAPPTAEAPAAAPPAPSATATPDAPGSLDSDIPPQSTTGPAEAAPTPGAADVPGGAAGETTQPSTAQ